jgi:nucleoside-diphosphate-sugar epimerase
MSGNGKRIVFTGGSGKAGRHVIPKLLACGYQVLNIDLVDFPDPTAGVFTLKADLTDSGQCFNALTSHYNFGGYEGPNNASPPDAVIHFAAYARNMLVPVLPPHPPITNPQANPLQDNECYRGNTTSTYNIIEAACKLGVKKIIIASSETTYEVCFGQGDLSYPSFPLDESLDVNPMDTYAISKLCGERVARGFARRFSADIYALRIGNVIEPHEYARDFPKYVSDPACRKRNAWSYIDARDLGQICDLCVKKDGLGFQVFNATNDGITTTVPTKELLKQMCPETEVTREMGEWEAPLSNKKIKDVLGFKEEHDWRQYYTPEKK